MMIGAGRQAAKAAKAATAVAMNSNFTKIVLPLSVESLTMISRSCRERQLRFFLSCIAVLLELSQASGQR